jgi:hypothetical protein
MLKKMVVFLVLIVIGFVSYQLLNEEKVMVVKQEVEIQIKKKSNKVDHDMRVVEQRIPTEEELEKIRKIRDRGLNKEKIKNKKENSENNIETFKLYKRIKKDKVGKGNIVDPSSYFLDFEYIEMDIIELINKSKNKINLTFPFPNTDETFTYNNCKINALEDIISCKEGKIFVTKKTKAMRLSLLKIPYAYSIEIGNGAGFVMKKDGFMKVAE